MIHNNPCLLHWSNTFFMSSLCWFAIENPVIVFLPYSMNWHKYHVFLLFSFIQYHHPRISHPPMLLHSALWIQLPLLCLSTSSETSLIPWLPPRSLSFPFFFLLFPPTSLQNRNEKEWCFIVFHLGTKFTTTTQFPLHFSPSFIVFLTKSRKSENDDNFHSFASQSECSSMTHLLSQSF